MELLSTAKTARPKNVVQSLERAGLILEVLSQHSQGLSLRDLSQKVKLTKGTTHRLLSSLAYLVVTVSAWRSIDSVLKPADQVD